MSDIFEFKMTGMDTLQKKLEALGKPTAKKIVRKALRAGGEVVQDAIVQNAPEDTGFMKEHFGMRTKLKSNELAGSCFVGPEGKVDYPDKDGTFRRRIERAGKKAIEVGRISVVSVVRFFEFGTSKMSKKPFMTQAFESKSSDALDAITEKLKDGIEEATK